MNDFLQSNWLTVLIWLIFAALALYAAAVVWSHLSLGKLFWQNIFGSNLVALPRIARQVTIPNTSSSSDETQVLVLSRTETEENQETDKAARSGGMIYPVAGRNGLHFSAARCTSCQLCVYVCPVGAITTQESSLGYIRSFDLTSCVYCGLCEAACPTQAIKLTVNQSATRRVLSSFKVQGEVEKKLCPECGRKIPFADLLAERIYNLDSFPLVQLVDETAETEADSDEGSQAKVLEFERGLAQMHPVCPTCQQTVLEQEEKICG